MNKICTKCGEAKPLAEFSKDARRLYGLRSNCRACDKAAKAKYYAANTDKVSAYAAKWRAANPEKVKARSAAWDAANQKKVKANSAAWAAANPEKVKAAVAKWQKANPEARRINKQNYRARKRGSGDKLSKDLTGRLFALQRGKCACGCKQPLGTDYHRDHIMPLVLGGSNTDDNIQLLRVTCNLQKHAKHPVDFMQQRGFLC